MLRSAVLYRSGPGIIRINENHACLCVARRQVNLVHPAREVPPKAANLKKYGHASSVRRSFNLGKIWICAVKKLLKINHENTKQDIEMNLAPFGRTWEILDTDFTDYTDFYFTNAAVFMKWKYCLNNINPIHSHPCNPCLKRKFLYYQVADILFVFSVFRAFVIILFFFVYCTI
jgi:hypothetical protein